MSRLKSIDDNPPMDRPPVDDAAPAGPPRGVRTMSIVRWVLVALAALVAVGTILHFGGVRLGGATTQSSGQLYYCPMHPSVVQDHPGECPICSMTLVPKPEGPAKPSSSMKPAPAAGTASGQAQPGGKYYCPMHPNRTSDDPNAKCPDCGMKMVPRPAAGEPAAAAQAAAPAAAVRGLAGVDLTPERIQLIGMKTSVVKREALGGELRTVGAVEASERGLAQVTTRFSGWIQALKVSATGERVRRGQVLATIYSPDVLRAQQELLVTRGWSAGAPAAGGAHDHDHDHEAPLAGLEDNARRRLELLGISSQEIDEILKSGKPVEAIAIRSPVEGFVVGKNALVGIAVQPGTVLFQVADLSTVWVTADIFEQDVSRIHVGQRARFELTAFPGEMHVGKVQFVYPTLDPANRTLRVRLEFKNRFDRTGPRLRPGMFGTVHLDLPATSGIMVPTEAVVDTGETHYLFVSQPGGHFEPRMVKIGARLKDRVEVLSGVAEGETVVTTGNFLVDSESRLRAAIEGQTSGVGEAPAGGSAPPSTCDTDYDKQKFPDKYQACRACEVQHRGMGTTEEDCKRAIPKPWR
jgi:Cu(I)/Ag(I) efflux system membrane fusion protein